MRDDIKAQIQNLYNMNIFMFHSDSLFYIFFGEKVFLPTCGALKNFFLSRKKMGVCPQMEAGPTIQMGPCPNGVSQHEPQGNWLGRIWQWRPQKLEC